MMNKDKVLKNLQNLCDDLGLSLKIKCADCLLNHELICTHDYPLKCIKCHHREDEHFSDDKGQCNECDCESLDTEIMEIK